jgi:Family of unknown function (DUF6267)
MPHFNFITTVLTEATRVEHPEDLVFTEGSRGALRALVDLENLAQNPDAEVSIKWDGSPAIIFGRRSADGKFTMNYKEWIGKPGGQVTSPDELAKFIQGRGGDKTTLIQKLVQAWPHFEAAVPTNFSGFVWGDLLYVGQPPATRGKFVFKPNTVTYSVPVKTPLGQRIANSQVGVAVHQYLGDVGQTPTTLKGTGGLLTDGSLLVLSGETPLPKITLNVTTLKQAQAWVKQHAQAIDEFINPANLSGMRGLGELMKRYINARVRTGKLDHLTDGWLEWIPNNAGSKGQGQRILEYSQQNEAGLIGILGSFVLITQVKMGLKQQLDQAQANAPVQASPGHEGYVIGSGDNKLKLVDRLQFSRLNFAKNG